MRTAAIVLAGVCLASCGGSSPSTQASAAASQPQQPAPAVPAAQPAAADLDAMPAGLPPLPTVPFPTALPMPVVRTVFVFAAEHPEVLSRIPCFCGCENRGHRHNDDCFVAGRDANGRVTAWEPHGLG